MVKCVIGGKGEFGLEAVNPEHRILPRHVDIGAVTAGQGVGAKIIIQVVHTYTMPGRGRQLAGIDTDGVRCLVGVGVSFLLHAASTDTARASVIALFK